MRQEHPRLDTPEQHGDLLPYYLYSEQNYVRPCNPSTIHNIEQKEEKNSNPKTNIYTSPLSCFNLKIADEEDWIRYSMFMEQLPWSEEEDKTVTEMLTYLHKRMTYIAEMVFQKKPTSKTPGNRNPPNIRRAMKK